jgi:hypothetical protein
MAEKPTRRGRGRPPLLELTPEVGDKILKLVKNGLPIELAAEANLVSRRTVLEWVARGEGRNEERPADPLYQDFAHRYRQARAQYAGALLQPCNMVLAGKRAPAKETDPESGKKVRTLGTTVRAKEAKWHLARRFPEFWGHGRETYEAVVDERSSSERDEEGTPQITIVLAGDVDDPTKPTTESDA